MSQITGRIRYNHLCGWSPRLHSISRTNYCDLDDPIFIPQMFEMMLEAKVQISEQLKREFQETLQSGADSFNKQMIIDLRKIVSKATKEHGLSMDKERKIVENLGRSEEWFVETFAQLKKICGQALHQIDFKDYQ